MDDPFNVDEGDGSLSDLDKLAKVIESDHCFIRYVHLSY